MDVLRSRFYQWKKQPKSNRAQEDEKLSQQIEEIFIEKKGRYGSPRITHELNRKGIVCSKHRVTRLMRVNGLVAKKAKKRKPNLKGVETERICPNILDRNFDVQQPNKAWVSDIKYIRTLEGWMYLCIVLDLFSRKVIGWSLCSTMKSSIVTEALEMAFLSRRPASSLIFHSDRGSQYQSDEVQGLLDKHGFIKSMSRKGNCWDNSVAESFFSTLEIELLTDLPLQTKSVTRMIIFEYIEIFYNRNRMHSSLGYATPQEFEHLFFSSPSSFAIAFTYEEAIGKLMGAEKISPERRT